MNPESVNPSDAPIDPGATDPTAFSIFGEESEQASVPGSVSVPDMVERLANQTLGEPDHSQPTAPAATPTSAPVTPPVTQAPVPPQTAPAQPTAPSAVPMTPQAPQVAPTIPGLDPAQVQQFLAWQAAQAQQSQHQVPLGTPQAQVQPQVPQKPTPSKEEVDRMLNVYQLNQADYDSIFETDSKEKSISALNDVLQKVVKQAVTMSHHLVLDQVGQLTQKVSPYMQFADSQREVALRTAFFDKNKDLVGQDVVVEFAMQQLIQEKETGRLQLQPNQDILDAVAERARSLRQIMVGGQVQVPPQQQAQQVPGQPAVYPSVKPQMAVLPYGAQSGAPSAAAQAAPGHNPTAVAIFG